MSKYAPMKNSKTTRDHVEEAQHQKQQGNKAAKKAAKILKKQRIAAKEHKFRESEI